ncbi:MAG: hypothetical protein QOH60_3838 [Mycobacterium sp.]|jgi:WD40 repeat protein|nr:hypothetical protein [Mycobacterium sp.]
MPRIFLSHSGKDNREATALKRWLEQQDPSFKRQIFLDIDHETGMVGGEEWRETLQRNLQSCEALLCLISKSWESSFECGGEFNYAVHNRKTIFCARLEPDSGTGEISKLQRRELFVADGSSATQIDLDDDRPPVEFRSDQLDLLLRDIRAFLGPDSFRRRWPPRDDPMRAPYRGWLPFEAQDAPVFFGRDAEIASALRKFDELYSSGGNRLFVILGPSGTGKSSFLRAGILPRLDFDQRFTLLDVVRPRSNVLTGEFGLANSLAASRKRLGLHDPSLEEIEDDWITSTPKVRQLLTECQHRAMRESGDPNAPQTLVMPLDQAEELFSAEAGAEAKVMLALLGDLLATSSDASGQTPLRLIVAATIRSDRYEAMQTAEELDGLDPLLFGQLGPMRGSDRLRQVIVEPARLSTERGRRLVIQSDLVGQLLDDAEANTGEGDTLPLLSATLELLYKKYGDTHELKTEQYKRIGGIDGVVETQINEILSPDPSVRADQLTRLREAFIPYLATVVAVQIPGEQREEDKSMRRIALWSDLPETSSELVEKFVEARILVRGKRRLSGAGEQDVVEIALERFLDLWPELKEWLRGESQNLKAADELLQGALVWQTRGRDAAYLLPGDRLKQAQELADSKTYSRKLEPTREFLRAGREQESRQQERKRRVLAALLAVAVVFAMAAAGLAAWALQQREVAQRNARDATAQKLISDAQAILADTRQGDDVLAFQELLVARKLATHPDERPLLDALTKRPTTALILRTQDPVVSVAYAERGHRLVAAEHQRVRTWDTNSPSWRNTIRDGNDRALTPRVDLTSVAIDPDGRKIAAGAVDGTVQLWNLDDRNPEPKVLASQHGQRVTRVAFSADGRYLASVGIDGIMNVSNPDGSDNHSITTPGELSTVALSPDGDRIAAGAPDGTIRVWDVADVIQPNGAATAGRPIGNAHPGGVMSVAFSPNGELIASGGADNTVRLWRAAELTPVALMPKGHTAPVTSVAFNLDGTRLVSGSNDKTVRLWDVALHQRIGDPMVGHEGLVPTVAFVGDQIISGGNEHTMRLWNTSISQPISDPLDRHGGAVTSVAVSHDGHRIASGGVDGSVSLWNSDTGTEIAEMPAPRGTVTRVVFDATDRTVISASSDGNIRLWRTDAPDSDAVTKIETGRPLSALAISPDGDRLASAGIDGQITMWQLPAGHPTPFENKDHAVVADVAFSPSGDRLASASAGGKLRMWQLPGANELWDADAASKLPEPFARQHHLADRHSGAVLSVAFSPDGRRLASGSAVWTTEPVRNVGATSESISVGVVQQWDATGQPVAQPIQIGSGVMSLAYSANSDDPVGARLAAASFDPYNVQIWGADSPDQALVAFSGHQAQVVGVVVSGQGRRIISGSADGTVRLWPNLPTVRAEDAICAMLTENMSQKEWDTSVSGDIDYRKGCDELPDAGDTPK